MQIIYSVLSFIVAIGVLVTVHEFGHYWVARKLGIKVLRFSVGFGRPLLSRRWGPDQTEYVLAMIPLGGYVQMLDENEAQVDSQELHRAFNRQLLWKRIAVVVAGPAFNFLFAIVGYTLVFMIGVSGLRALVGEVGNDTIAERAGFVQGQEIVAVGDVQVQTWEQVIQQFIGRSLETKVIPITVRESSGYKQLLQMDIKEIGVDDLTQGQFFDSLGLAPERPDIPPIIGDLTSGGAAERAGVLKGDRVLSADGNSIETWGAWVEYVRARPEQPLTITIQRGNTQQDLEITPEAVTDSGKTIGRIGALRGADVEALKDQYYVTLRYAPWTSLALGAEKTLDITMLTLRMLWRMVLLEVSVSNLSGPISIAQYAGVTAQIGFERFVEFLAVISVSLGILNLLPIPVLDGGHLLYYLVEGIKGGPVSENLQIFGQRLGITLLMGLMGIAFYNDLVRVFG